jgi:hypothetical protein
MFIQPKFASAKLSLDSAKVRQGHGHWVPIWACSIEDAAGVASGAGSGALYVGIHNCNETDEQVFIMLLPMRGNSAVVGIQLCWLLN